MCASRIYLSSPHMGGEELDLVKEAFATNWIAPLGPHVDAFEDEIARAVGVAHAAALSSGTAALHLAMRLLGVGSRIKDLVIVAGQNFAPSDIESAAAEVACNVYYRRMFDQPKPKWVYDRDLAMPTPPTAPIYSLDRYWPGAVRIDYQSGPQDFVGIYVQSQYISPTGMFKNRRVSNFGVVRIEPSRANK